MQPRSNQHPRDPGEQSRYDPQRDRSPSIAAPFGRADCRYSLRRQHQPIARDVVDLIEQRTGTRQQARKLTEETADLAGSLDRILEWDMQLVMMGSGDPEAERFFASRARSRPDRFCAWLTFDGMTSATGTPRAAP